MQGSTLTVQMQNHSMMAVLCEPGVRHELWASISRSWSQGQSSCLRIKRKQWDGKIRLFNNLTCELNVGLYTKLCKFASDRHYHISAEA